MITGQMAAITPGDGGNAGRLLNNRAAELEKCRGCPADAPGLCSRRLRDTVRAARQARGLTQRQAATALDWSLSKLVRIETGRCGISVTGLASYLEEERAAAQIRRCTGIGLPNLLQLPGHE